MEEGWTRIREIIDQTAEKVLGNKRTKEKQYWMDEECKRAVEEGTSERLLKCEMERLAKKICRRQDREVINRREGLYQQKGIRYFYKKFENNVKRYVPTIGFGYNNDNILLGNL